MEKIKENPILEFNPNQLSEVRKLFNYDDKNRLEQDLQILEEWIKKQNHFLFKDFDREYLERYLINSKGSVERAKKHLDKLCTLRGFMPQYLQGFDIRNEFTSIFKCSYSLVLPKPTPDNYRVIVTNVYNPDEYQHFDLLRFSRYFLVVIEYLCCHDYSAGLELIGDTRNYTLGVISKLNPVVIANIFMLIVEALGFRLKAIHLISGSKLVETIVGIVKRGLTQKLTDRLYVHDNLESLHKMVAKEILPKDLGGDEPTMKEIYDKNFKEMSSDGHVERMKFVETVATNEALRIGPSFNDEYTGMPGSFKVLQVD